MQSSIWKTLLRGIKGMNGMEKDDSKFKIPVVIITLSFGIVCPARTQDPGLRTLDSLLFPSMAA
jgi:hypothetical protein